MSHIEFTTRVLVAILAGMAIGFERQWHHKAAGLRTTTLVALGSAVYVLLSINVTQTSGDVTRIIGQVVTGIGFLCAGVVFKDGASIYGLTTSVIIWCSSAIGCLAAAGYYIETLIATSFVLAVNVGLKSVDVWLTNRQKGKEDQQ